MFDKINLLSVAPSADCIIEVCLRVQETEEVLVHRDVAGAGGEVYHLAIRVDEMDDERRAPWVLLHNLGEGYGGALTDIVGSDGDSETLDDIIDLHQKFETIHPFQDGNGRVGRLVMFKECLANGIVPFIITEKLKLFYYRGLREWGHVNGYLTDTCLTAQDHYKALLDYFKIKY